MWYTVVPTYLLSLIIGSILVDMQSVIMYSFIDNWFHPSRHAITDQLTPMVKSKNLFLDAMHPSSAF